MPIGTVVLLAAAFGATQPPGTEQRAFDAVDRAIAGLESTVGRDATIRAARGVLDTAEDALSAFNAPDQVRDATYARYVAALSEVDALAVRCDNDYPCDTDERGNTGVVYFDGLVAAYARVWRARSRLSAANAAYVEAVGIAGAVEARERAARFRRYAIRMRRLRGNSNHMLARQRVLIHASNAENNSHNALHDRAIAAHVAANRDALNALRHTARALSMAAERLPDDSHGGIRAAEVSRAAGQAEDTAAAAADPAVSNDGIRTDAALEELMAVVRETFAAIEQRRRRISVSKSGMRTTRSNRSPAAGWAARRAPGTGASATGRSWSHRGPCALR